MFERLGLPADDGIRLLISPTSWTADERLELLFEALESTRRERDAIRDFPFLAVLIAGKGPLEGVSTSVSQPATSERVRIQTGWLPSTVTPRRWRPRDLGISCHVSASSLDLPDEDPRPVRSRRPVCASITAPVFWSWSPPATMAYVQDRQEC